MINIIDNQYKTIVSNVLNYGTKVKGRNGNILLMPSYTFAFDLSKGRFPIISLRKIYTSGVLGELVALLKGVSNVQDFKDQGCNYWDKWAGPNGELNLDYSN